jgi:glycerol-3-phosphate cytidylyltransferase-like family protein
MTRLEGRFQVGERVVRPGRDGPYPDHSKDRWGYVTEIRRITKVVEVEELVVTFDGEAPRAINPDVIAYGDDWRHVEHDPQGGYGK